MFLIATLLKNRAEAMKILEEVPEGSVHVEHHPQDLAGRTDVPCGGGGDARAEGRADAQPRATGRLVPAVDQGQDRAGRRGRGRYR